MFANRFQSRIGSLVLWGRVTLPQPLLVNGCARAAAGSTSLGNVAAASAPAAEPPAAPMAGDSRAVRDDVAAAAYSTKRGWCNYSI